jgi:integrase
MLEHDETPLHASFLRLKETSLMRSHLTELSLRAVKPQGKQIKIWDRTTPGFGVRINGASKSWIVMYGQRRSLKVIGRYPEISLADARKVARKLLATYQERPQTVTFGEALERYYAIHFPTLRDSTAYTRKGVIERRYRKWERREICEITSQDIVHTLDGMLDTPVERYNAFKELKFFLRWCVGRQYLETNPCERLQPPRRGPARDRVLSDEELRTVWDAAEATTPVLFGNVVKMLILTGQRRGEVAKMRWEWIDTVARTITIPREVAKNGRQHTFSCSPDSIRATTEAGL